jgi:hypothetical protein
VDEDEKTEMYVCPRAPSLNMKLCGEKVRAENGLLKLTKKQAAELEGLKRKGRHDLAILSRVDMEGAVAQVREHQAQRRNAAVPGTMNSSNARDARLGREKLLKTAQSERASLPGKNDVASVSENLGSSVPDNVKTTDETTDTGEDTKPKAGFAARTSS